MSEAEEYIQNAQICAAAAESTKSENDRAIGLRISEAWRDLAAISDQHASPVDHSEPPPRSAAAAAR